MTRHGLLALAALFLIGCGGMGEKTVAGTDGGNAGGGSTGGDGSWTGGDSGGDGGGTGGDGQTSVVASTTPGKIDLNVITGIGRSSGTIRIDIDRVEYGRVGSSSLVSSLSPAKRVALDGYTHDLVTSGIGLLPATQQFNQFSFRISKMILPDETQVSASLATQAPASFFASRGRTTSLRLALDESMVYDDGGSVLLDRYMFDAANIDAFGGSMPAFFSDLVRVPIGFVAERPTFSDGSPASYLFLSGDLLGISNSGSSLEVLFGENRFLDHEPMRAGSYSGASSGIYALNESDPRDPAGMLRRLEGTWNGVEQVVRNVGNFLMLSFPSANPAMPAQLVIFSRGESGQIDQCYVGEMNTDTLSFVAYPVVYLGLLPQQMVGGSFTDEGAGGSFTFQYGNVPSSFPGTGTYLKFVR